MKRTMYLVVFKDHRGVPTRYFGPFATETQAYFFQASIGQPMEDKGGFTSVEMLQPFASFEGRTVAQLIKRERERGPHHEIV